MEEAFTAKLKTLAQEADCLAARYLREDHENPAMSADTILYQMRQLEKWVGRVIRVDNIPHYDPEHETPENAAILAEFDEHIAGGEIITIGVTVASSQRLPRGNTHHAERIYRKYWKQILNTLLAYPSTVSARDFEIDPDRIQIIDGTIAYKMDAAPHAVLEPSKDVTFGYNVLNFGLPTAEGGHLFHCESTGSDAMHGKDSDHPTLAHRIDDRYLSFRRRDAEKGSISLAYHGTGFINPRESFVGRTGVHFSPITGQTISFLFPDPYAEPIGWKLVAKMAESR